MMEALAPDLRVIALEYPFFEDRTLNSVRALTDYTLEFIDAQGLDQVSLCGNSLGGQIALDLALQHRSRVSRLILTGSAGLWEAQANGQLPKATRPFIRQQAEKVFFDPRHVDDALVEKLYQSLKDRTYVRTLLRLARDTQTYTLHNQLERVRVPVLLVWGENDQVTPPEVARTFHALIPCSQLVFLAACGHAPPLEQPEAFTAEIRKFMVGGA
jgi:pimeloyl-ACP methyl ester carboxylesterase